MNHSDILSQASKEIRRLKGRTLDILEIKKPHNTEHVQYLSRVISKISPFVGNLLEFSIIEKLNEADWKDLGEWVRRDPGFPDAVLQGQLEPAPGIEIKTWLPLATEITARFRNSASFFRKNQTNVAVVAWLPEFILYGKPKIIDIWIGSAKSIALTRDRHYHNPPDYLVFEPEDTSLRASNLRQTNTNGYKFQGSVKLLEKARVDVRRWGRKGLTFSSAPEYQKKLKELLGKYPYRLDTNFAKMDRIRHSDLEKFKARVLATRIDDRTLLEWTQGEWRNVP